MRAPELVERFEWYVVEKAKGEEELRRLQEHVAGLEGKLADAEERARVVEQARIAAKEKARRLDEEAEHVIEAFQTSPAFDEAALSRMDDLLKIWAQTPAGQRLLLKEGQTNYSLGLQRAQEVLLERIRKGKELPKPCEDPEEFDSSIYYSEDEDANGGGEDTAGGRTAVAGVLVLAHTGPCPRLARLGMLASPRRPTEDERGLAFSARCSDQTPWPWCLCHVLSPFSGMNKI
ncbi:unnamed protein product [Cuscuta campestris]|uniref:Uncharacterized protein n=1 Tax=Cuscuta campestris TaxID=132261 RepID=A0A484N1B4_9ASTE|nr:unnamed protein product [Cuscuta campestris]